MTAQQFKFAACVLVFFDLVLPFFMVEHGWTFVELHVVLLNLHASRVVAVQHFDVVVMPAQKKKRVVHTTHACTHARTHARTEAYLNTSTQVRPYVASWAIV